MIWTYTLAESNELQARDAHSLSELQDLIGKVNWVWIDCMEPDEKELEIIAGLPEGTMIASAFSQSQVYSRCKGINDHVLLSIPMVVFGDTLKTYPIYVLAKENTLVTVRSKHSSKSIDNALKTLQDCISKVCELGILSSFVVNRLLYEISDGNLDVVMGIRTCADEIEEKALVNPRDKQVSKKVFALKREIITLERILWTQRDLMLSIEEGVVPVIQSSDPVRQTLSHSVSNVSRELSLISSIDNALDSILSLQDLGMIHRVERILIYLTLVTLAVNILMIFIEVNIWKIFSG